MLVNLPYDSDTEHEVQIVTHSSSPREDMRICALLDVVWGCCTVLCGL